MRSELLVSLARLGALKLVCVEDSGAAASAALLAAGRAQLSGKPGVSAAARLLAFLAACLKLRGLLLLTGSAAWFPRYRRILRQVEKPCHLLFIASLLPGRGYGSRVLKTVEEECRRLGRQAVILEVDLENRALMFYARRGYPTLEERKLVDVIREKGEVFQEELPELNRFSKPKISRMVAELSDRKVIIREKYGKTYIIKLSDRARNL